MTRLLRGLARLATRRARFVLAAWLVAAVVVVVASAGITSRSGGDAAIPGTDSERASAMLEAAFPDQEGASSPLVLHASSGSLADGTAEDVARELAPLGVVASSTAGQRSKDGSTQLVDVQLAVDPQDLTHEQAEQVLEAARAAAGRGEATVEAAGVIGQKLSRPESRRSEAIGLAVAVLILLAVGGTVPTMLLPILTAIAGLVLGLRSIALLGSITSLPSATTTLATMIGLGVGIDYGLFLLARIRGFRAEGREMEDAIRAAMATTGGAVLFAAATVAIALCSLAIAGLAPVSKLGIAAAVTVVTAVAAALTLLPALTMVLGDRIERLRVRRTTMIDESPGWRRWGERVARAPWRALGASVLLLAALSAPALTLTLGSERPSDQPESTTLRRSADQISAAFGPGASGPMTVVARLDSPATSTRDQAIVDLRSDLSRTPGVAAVAPARLSDDQRTLALTVTPKYEPGAEENIDLVDRLRTDVLPAALPGAETHVGGPSVVPIDLAERVASALPMIVGTVVALAFVLLLIAFRSIVLPLKAAAANLLSVGAAYGVLTAVFQHGWGAELIGLDGPVPIVSYVPMFMFAVLFGLSMDYEVFLLSRVQERHHAGDTDEQAIVRGLAATGRLITAAALIMVAVFASFVLSPDPTIKMFGIGLAVAIAVDATIVRCLLVPAAMLLMGQANWWLPGWLAQRLPAVSVD